ncbi:MAG TPA: hypothetical protein VHN39_02965 [Phenylobacterium sp.]|jgi:hypothetical protein|nr:hypothetical protein [Phenylobacterium sp.]
MTPTPRAVSHFGLAAMEARAVRTRRIVAPAASAPPPARLRPQPEVQPRRFRLRLWLPLTPLFLLLAPFALLLAPFVYFAPRPYGERPFATVLGVGALLLSLGGTVIDIDARDALIRIKIF